MTDRLAALAARAVWPRDPEPWLIACSGGPDSLALLALAATTGHPLVVAHVDHGLRPDSTRDRDVVAAAAARFGAPLAHASLAIARGANLEARAREARYAALGALAAEHGAGPILTGHTLDDQAETVLLATLRGAGIDGLAGIAPRRGALHRPLLGLRRAETAEVCRLVDLAPVADPMNDDVAFRRVWLRREVLPRLHAGADRDLAPVLARQAAVLREERTVLDALAADLVAERLDVAALLAAPPAIARRAVRIWLAIPIPSAHADAVLALAAGRGTAVDVGGGWRVRRSAGRLVREPAGSAGPSSAPVPGAEPLVVQLPVPGAVELGAVRVEARVERVAPVGWPDGRATAVLDADVVGDALVLRRPDPDERVARASGNPTVVAARKRAGVPVDLRATLPVVAAPDGTIAWVLGYGASAAASVSHRTRRWCWISWYWTSVEPTSEAVAQ